MCVCVCVCVYVCMCVCVYVYVCVCACALYLRSEYFVGRRQAVVHHETIYKREKHAIPPQTTTHGRKYDEVSGRAHDLTHELA
jgi:hypothetical protein